jgi:hypothetical protein
MMRKIQTIHILAGVLLVLTLGTQALAQSPGSRPADDCENAKSKAQSRSVDDVDILVRAEKRVERLRDQLLDLQVQEISLQCRLDDLDYRLTAESIQTTMMFVGSPRPMDELRDELRQRLEAEKAATSATGRLRVRVRAQILRNRHTRPGVIPRVVIGLT